MAVKYENLVLGHALHKTGNTAQDPQQLDTITLPTNGYTREKTAFSTAVP